MSATDFASYLAALEPRLQAEGFQKLPDVPVETDAAVAYRKRKFEITKFGLVDRFAIPVWRAGSELTDDWLRDYGTRCFAYALKNKSWLPRGFFGMAIAYPLVVTDVLEPPLEELVTRGYCPKHWASSEFPAVFDLRRGTVFHYEATPTWGAAYYPGMRTEVARLYGEGE